MKKESTIQAKIDELFQYREIHYLLDIVSSAKRKKKLTSQLVALQKAIYDLDAYLEQRWKVKEKKLNKLWESIYETARKAGIAYENLDKSLSHIKRYQTHELNLRKGKLPTSYKPDYYYYYKSCDVRLIRGIIYDKYPELNELFKIKDWRDYDLITEVNDDIEDVFEDNALYNGNMFLAHINENGLKAAEKAMADFISELETRVKNKILKTTKAYDLRLLLWTLERVIETRELLEEVVCILATEELKPSVLFDKLSGSSSEKEDEPVDNQS